MRLLSKGSLLALPKNIRLGWKFLTVNNESHSIDKLVCLPL